MIADVLVRPLAPADSLEALTALLHRACARLGCAEVDSVQWDGKRYRSLILVKALDGPAPTIHDDAHHDAQALAAA